VRVPFFVYWKDKIKAGENDHLCVLYDVLATAADLAGVMPPKTDGISFAPTLLARPNEQRTHEYLYWENKCSYLKHENPATHITNEFTHISHSARGMRKW